MADRQLISAPAAFGFLGKPQLTDVANLSRCAVLLTFAGVGQRTNIRDLRVQGWRPSAVGALGEVAIAVLTLGLVVGADRVFRL